MSSSKKRRLNGKSDAPPLSAFAAIRSAQDKKTTKAVRSPSAKLIHTKDVSTKSLLVSTTKPSLPSFETLVGDSKQDSLQTRPIALSIDSEDTENVVGSSLQSRDDSPELVLETPVITLSSLKPGVNNVKDSKDGSLVVKVAPGERLVILGQFDISIRKGRITLLGSTLLPSKIKHRVYVPLSHSLPVIRCMATDVDDAELCLHQSESGLERLTSLSSLFGRLWNNDVGPLGPDYETLSKINQSSFQILFSSNDGPKKTYLQPIISAPEWNAALSKLSVDSDKQALRIVVCGPKSSGKSTFTKLLSNRLLSAAADRAGVSTSEEPRASGVAILDLDPGQAEYSVPGQLSLVHVQQPNFGPPFSHPIPDGQSRIIRAHTIASITPSMDPGFYMACALDLFAHYQNLLSANPSCPLIVNTPGWILGTGLEILVDLICRIRPTEVIYMSQKGPLEVVESLQEAAKAQPIITLPSQVSEYATKTAAHLRTMQLMSYFHIDCAQRESLVWNDTPLTSMPPWEILYKGDNAGLLGIMCYGEQPPPDLLLDSINGALVGVVVLDDMAAIPGWQFAGKEEANESENPENSQPYVIESADAEIRIFDDELHSLEPFEKPMIVRTPEQNLPYFNPANTITLDPKHSHCIGVALVRGIDITRQRLQVITPISPSLIQEINEAGETIVLVSGKYDTPGWAYTEEIMQHRSFQKDTTLQNVENLEEDDQGDEESEDRKIRGQGTELAEAFNNPPWIERQDGSQGRTIGSRVWRVRRDLGKAGE